MTNLSLANVTESNTISWKLPLTHSILALEFKFQNIHIKPKKKNHNFFYGKKKKKSIIHWLSFMTFSYSLQLTFSYLKNKTNRKAAVVLYKLSFLTFQY